MRHCSRAEGRAVRFVEAAPFVRERIRSGRGWKHKINSAHRRKARDWPRLFYCTTEVRADNTKSGLSGGRYTARDDLLAAFGRTYKGTNNLNYLSDVCARCQEKNRETSVLTRKVFIDTERKTKVLRRYVGAVGAGAFPR